MIGRSTPSSQQGFTMLELLMAMAISLIILAMGAGLVLQGLPVEKRLASEVAKLELAARKAAMQLMGLTLAGTRRGEGGSGVVLRQCEEGRCWLQRLCRFLPGLFSSSLLPL